jgi:transcription elongation factor GreA
MPEALCIETERAQGVCGRVVLSNTKATLQIILASQDGKAAAKKVPEGPMPDHIKKRLEEEIKLLERELTTELPAEIKKAVALGDLSENAEYHMAKQRQVFVNARLGQLKKRMGELAMVNLVNIPHDKVGFGATVVVFDSSKNEEISYKLVTSEESDVTKGLISTTSPIGRALLGKKLGDIATVVTPNGKRELEVLKLTTIHDEVAEDIPDADVAAG